MKILDIIKISMNKKINKEKFKNTVLYLAKNGGMDVGKKKLAKLLYFIDFTLYEIRKKSLTGMTYSKMNYGPMPEPIVFYKALGDLKENNVIDIKREGYLERIIPKEGKINMDVFDKEEKEVLQQITEKYRLENAGNLEREAQSEPPYKMVGYGEEIPFHLAFYRNSFGEMDLDD
jgi:uncharacterized phage-associated protein